MINFHLITTVTATKAMHATVNKRECVGVKYRAKITITTIIIIRVNIIIFIVIIIIICNVGGIANAVGIEL